MHLDWEISCHHNNVMLIEFDSIKRSKTLAECGLDFAQAGAAFDGLHFTDEDLREVYAEPRFVTIGPVDGRLMVLVWTSRGRLAPHHLNEESQ